MYILIVDIKATKDLKYLSKLCKQIFYHFGWRRKKKEKGKKREKGMTYVALRRTLYFGNPRIMAALLTPCN